MTPGPRLPETFDVHIERRTGRFERAGRARPSEIEGELAELHATRRRLIGELEAMGERVERIDALRREATTTDRRQGTPAPDLSAIAAKLLEVQRQLAAARGAQAAARDAQVVTRHDMLQAPAAQRPSRRRRALTAAAGLGLLGAAAAGGAVAASQAGDDPARPTQAPRAAAPAAALPTPCVDAPATGTCTTGRLLTVAAAGETLRLPDLEASVLRSVRTRSLMSVSVRLQLPGGQRTAAAVAGPGQLYVTAGGLRLRPVDAEPVRLAAGQTETVTRRFRLGDRERAALRRAGNRADLGVVGPAEAARSGEPRRLGVIRLALQRP